MTPAEILRELIKKDGKPERQLKQYEAFELVFGDPVGAYTFGSRMKNNRDLFGVEFVFPKGAPGPMPHITEENKVCKDITHWRDYVHCPDLIANAGMPEHEPAWEETRKRCDEARSRGKLAMALMGTGIFEQCHFLMGFEDTLTAFQEHPQEMHELVDEIFEYRYTYMKLLVDNMHPDVILSHDDWGTKNSLFMQPDVWREYFKEPYRKFYGYMREHGVIAMHHADSYLAPIVEDMAEIGIQIWQGTLPENNIPELQERLKGSMVLMGGVGAAIDREDTTEEEALQYVREVCEECCPRGHFIPCITYGLAGTVYKFVDPWIDAAIDEYNSISHLPNYRPSAPPRRVFTQKQESMQTVTETKEAVSVLEKLAAATKKGQKKKVLSLCEEALAEGISAQTILSDALVVGMNDLGADFSANKAFVPEMLMGAKCMNAATELLKPYLVGEGGESKGRACLGTVKGDMHDIGKNLVKVMMEGSGIEVIDLGTDVSAETFVQTAIDKECDIIACSALLTTTMSEMRRVVELAKERGIRDKVRIHIGGAPISQEFCDEIGADVYTRDAGEAARRAVEDLAQFKKA